MPPSDGRALDLFRHRPTQDRVDGECRKRTRETLCSGRRMYRPVRFFGTLFPGRFRPVLPRSYARQAPGKAVRSPCSSGISSPFARPRGRARTGPFPGAVLKKKVRISPVLRKTRTPGVRLFWRGECRAAIATPAPRERNVRVLKSASLTPPSRQNGGVLYRVTLYQHRTEITPTSHRNASHGNGLRRERQPMHLIHVPHGNGFRVLHGMCYLCATDCRTKYALHVASHALLDETHTNCTRRAGRTAHGLQTPVPSGIRAVSGAVFDKTLARQSFDSRVHIMRPCMSHRMRCGTVYLLKCTRNAHAV